MTDLFINFFVSRETAVNYICKLGWWHYRCYRHYDIWKYYTDKWLTSEMSESPSSLHGV